MWEITPSLTAPLVLRLVSDRKLTLSTLEHLNASFHFVAAILSQAEKTAVSWL
jgi:hypothetical protein